MSIHYSDDTVTLHHGDSLNILRTLPDESVNCCVTSPPYFGLRDYGVKGQIGAEASPAEFVERLRALFGEVQRVLADDGTLWVNLGDSYYSGRGNPGVNSVDDKQSARRGFTRVVDKPGQSWAKPKDLLGIPWRVAFALQDDGWTLRNSIIWHKPNAMPESVTDRLSCAHENLFLFTKSRRYWFDVDPIRREYAETSVVRANYAFKAGAEEGTNGRSNGPLRSSRGAGKADGTNLGVTGKRHTAGNPKGANPGDVWTIPTSPFPGSHFAVFPPALAERCVVAGCKPGGVVLDPFSGSGTTGMVAARNGRKYVGIDLNADYLDLSLRTRLAQSALADDDGDEDVA